jgi:hypothetical protein
MQSHYRTLFLSPDLQRAANLPPKNTINDNLYYANRAKRMPKLALALFAPGSAVRSPNAEQ